MVAFSNLVAALVGVVGLIVLVVGRVPISGWKMARHVLIRVAGAVLLLPWPASHGLALVAKVAREMDGNPPDKPETVALLTAFVQLVLILLTGVTSLVLIVAAKSASTPSSDESIRTAGE